MKNIIYIFLLVFLIANTKVSYAQIDILGKIKDKIEEKTNEKTDEAIDKSMEESNQEENTSDQVENTSNEGENNAEQSEEVKPQENKPVKKESLKTYSKFDFVPGEKTVYYDDFSQDAIGDFPVSWNTNGSGEVQTTNLYPGNWFKMTGQGFYMPDPFIELPDNFTIQYDLIMQEDPENNSNNFETGIYIYENNPEVHDEGGAVPGFAGIKLWFGQWGLSWGNYEYGSYIMEGRKDIKERHFDEIAKISIWRQKQRIRVYLNEEKVFDIPKALPINHKYNTLSFIPYQGFPLISNLRIAVGAPDMRSKLLTDGKLVTHGILFDVNSEKIKPESYGTLKEIAKVLQENSSVRVKIVGHTDSDGSDVSNLELSKKRAASVKSSLKTEFGIDESRMETDGKGESESVADNTTSIGKAENRRVEFIKL